MSKNWQAYVQYILDCIAKIRGIQARGNITEDEILYDATLRNLHPLSEATQRLPDTIKNNYPKIPWQEISGFRNILVHNYLGNIDPLTIMSVIENYLQPLEDCILVILVDKDSNV